MDISYKMQDDLDWNNAETIDIKPKGWKQVRVSFIDSYPMVFWRINGIEKNFMSSTDLVSTKGVYEFFSGSLETLKMMIDGGIDSMPEERRRFYKENIMELFDE
jgi:hypothetical protein